MPPERYRPAFGTATVGDTRGPGDRSVLVPKQGLLANRACAETRAWGGSGERPTGATADGTWCRVELGHARGGRVARSALFRMLEPRER